MGELTGYFNFVFIIILKHINNHVSTVSAELLKKQPNISSKEGMAGSCAESTVVLTDEKLKEDIRENYPESWKRMQMRRKYIQGELNITLSEDVLPMCSIVAYLRPFLLNKKYALKRK